MANKKKKNISLEDIFFWAILLIFLLKGLFYIFLIPPWEAPDENAHVAYVHYLYHNHVLPDYKTKKEVIDVTLSKSRVSQRILLIKIQDRITRRQELYNRNQYTTAVYVGPAAGNPPLYYVYSLPFYLLSLFFKSYWSLIFLRVGSLLLGFLALIVIYKIVQILFPKSSIFPFLTMLLVMLNPMLTFMTAVVNTDSIILLSFTLFVYFTLRFIVLIPHPTIRNLILVGFISSLASLSKPNMMILIPVYLVYLIIFKQLTKKNLIFSFISSICIPIIFYGIKFMLYGMSSLTYSFLDIKSQPASFWKYPINFILDKQPVGIFMSFWGFFGWLDVPMPKWIYALFLLVIVIAIGGWIYVFKNKIRLIPTPSKAHFFVYITSIAYILTIFLFDIVGFVQTHHFSIQGRYFLPVLFVVVILILQGVFFYEAKFLLVLLIFCIIVFVISQILMYLTISHHYYNMYVFISPLTKMYTR